MSLENLEQALFEAKWGDAEEDAIGVIARALELSYEAVARVLYAASAIRDLAHSEYAAAPRFIDNMAEGSSLDAGLRNAIRIVMHEGLARACVRWAINNEKPMLVQPNKLITEASEICFGCDHSIACISNNYSTPVDCFAKGPPCGIKSGHDGFFQIMRLKKGAALVQPIKIVKDTVTVTCTHPKGTFKVEAVDLSL
jgi:hypothetical protein